MAQTLTITGRITLKNGDSFALTATEIPTDRASALSQSFGEFALDLLMTPSGGTPEPFRLHAVT